MIIMVCLFDCNKYRSILSSVFSLLDFIHTNPDYSGSNFERELVEFYKYVCDSSVNQVVNID